VIPPGPIKLGISGLPTPAGSSMPAGDVGIAKPIIEDGGSAISSCLSLLGAAVMLVGFVLPWFACKVALPAIRGSGNGLAALIRLGSGVLVSRLGSAGVGAQSGGGGIAALGLLLGFVLVSAAVFLALSPMMGVRYHWVRFGFPRRHHHFNCRCPLRTHAGPSWGRTGVFKVR
jgi:hypothetical protein